MATCKTLVEAICFADFALWRPSGRNTLQKQHYRLHLRTEILLSLCDLSWSKPSKAQANQDFLPTQIDKKDTMKVNLADSAADDLEQLLEDLREVLGKMFIEEALTSNTIKMVEGLLRDGFMNVGLDIGSKIEKSKEMPQVVIDTAVIEHYVARGRTKDALKVFKHMLVSSVCLHLFHHHQGSCCCRP